MSNHQSSNSPFELFIGPCVLENESLVLSMAEYLVKNLEPLRQRFPFHLTFKGSFDKANRSSYDSYRGPGLEEGLRLLEKVKKTFNLPTVTDFHTPDQAKAVASVVDTLQIPAFLCRQTDMIFEGAKAAHHYGRRLKIKKGQFLSPEEAANLVEKAKQFLPVNQILLTERGSSFGYQNLIVDMTSFQIMKQSGVKTIHDATHCVQRPGSLGKSTGGKREYIYTLARAAVAAGTDGLFMEAHPDPKNALSDSTTSLPLDSIPLFIKNLLLLRERYLELEEITL
jgi:2-dehydro-3-deoxyphosphooctonate aldolase (KDO 8-P synthase)